MSWIDIDFEKPDVGVEVIIQTEDGNVTTDVYFDKGYANGFTKFDGLVVYWQNLPVPREFDHWCL